jgi:DNA-binding response OmpR family regulator
VRLLIAEDDPTLALGLEKDFVLEGYDVVVARDGTTACRLALTESFDLVILDVMLPGQDGFEVCRTIRKSSAVPIIMLTARGEVTDRIVGLEIGADDYMPKPFEPRELVARIQGVLRRSASARPQGQKLSYEGLEIDLERRSAELDGETLDLTTMEYQLLALFAQNPRKTYTRDEILNELRGIDAQLFSRSVDILVSRLRQKLGDTSKQARYIKTVWGTGYAFIGQEAST